MKKHKCCKDCIFFKPNGFQDMGAVCDVCTLIGHHKDYSVWDGLLHNEKGINIPCKYFTNKKELIKNILGNDFKEED